MRKDSVIEVNNKKVIKIEENKKRVQYTTEMQHVFIIGSKGIPAAYGGFETFVEKLSEYRVSDKIEYHVACMGKDSDHYEYKGTKCFNVKVPNIGPARAIFYDIAALKNCIEYCKARLSIEHPIFYILACRIGPFIGHYKKQIEKLGGILYVNPDGHEWKRAKWSAPVRKYWKISEKLMVKHADLLICDSKNIERYIQNDYAKYHPKTTFIAYGSDTKPSTLKDDDKKFTDWLQEKELATKEYFLVVGRLVPENNFETMIREFMKSKTTKNLAIIATANDAFLNELESRIHFKSDNRIKFVDTVYDQELLKKIRECAYGYLHGHEVGGTNPSLLEALSYTDLNFLLDVGFNKEVGEKAAIYWNKESGNLAQLIDKSIGISAEEIAWLGTRAKNRIVKAYNWNFIVNEYEEIFLNDVK